MTVNYYEMAKKLPKPRTLEEQYLYSIICEASGKTYVLPYSHPFWRMQQYWQVFYGIMADKLVNIRPSVGTVTEESLSEAVEGRLLGINRISTKHIKSGAVTTDKLADSSVTEVKLKDGSVTNAKLADGSVTNTKVSDKAITESKLASSVVGKLLANDIITEEMLVNALRSKLLGEGRITEAMLDSSLQEKIAKIK